MHIVPIRPGTPPEPVRFARRLARLRPIESGIALANAVPNPIADEPFTQTRDLGPLTLHAMQRALLIRSREEPAATPIGAKHRDLKYFLRQFLAIRAQLPALRRVSTEPLEIRVTRSLWCSAIEQELLSTNVKYDLGRAWLMYEEVWPDLLRAGTVTVPPGLIPTAIGAVHSALLLTLGCCVSRGYIADPATYFGQTSIGSHIQLLLNQFAIPTEELTPILRAASQPENAIRNCFINYPLIQLEDGGLLAPDPAILLNAFERAILVRLLSDYTQDDGAAGFDRISSAFGHIFEEYGRRLLRAGVRLGGQFLDEFKYDHMGNEVASPDAFVLSNTRSLVFEFKATRYPHDLSDLATDPVGHLWQWVAKLLGATAARPALQQGSDFFARAPHLPEVSAYNLSAALYLICTYPRVPAMLNWEPWRRAALSSNPVLQNPLLGRTCFVSVVDVELALTAASTPGGPAFSDLIDEWWQVTQNAQALSHVQGLGDFVLSRYDHTSSADLPILANARTALFAATNDAAFGEPHRMPKNWWLVTSKAG